MAWNPSIPQPITTSTHMVRRMNQVALAVLDRVDTAREILIIDGFNTTINRPDHTGIRGIFSGAKMVHHGDEIMNLHNRLFLSMLMHRYCSSSMLHWQANLGVNV